MSVSVIRTPEDRFADLPDIPYQPHYRTVDGLRLAHLDEGDGPPVVFFHGEPTWSFLWRAVIPPVRDAGFRCVSPDYAGLGRSDKPTDPEWYTYDRHVEHMTALFDELDLRDGTVVLHDWGGPIGLRLAVDHPDRIARLVLMDTGPFTGHQRMTEAWHRFRLFVARTDDLPIGMLVRRACYTDPGDAVAAAYDAPFTTSESKAGAKALPDMLPLTPDAPGAAAGRRVAAALRDDDRPALMLWADSDAALPIAFGEAVASALRYPRPRVITKAGHFVPEDAGPEIGRLIAEWLTKRP
jgi:haloalkane dehalogenase